MNLIDPKGLFDGERLAACSDLARLHWPWLYLGANGFARLELSYPAITSAIYRSFKKPPTEDQLWSIFEEYAANFLVILYQANGTWWAQFVTSEKWLPRYKTARDQSSPAPSLDLTERHRKGYIQWKSTKSVLNQRFQKFSETSGNVQDISAAVAVAVAGAGEDAVANANKGLSPLSPQSATGPSPSDFFETWNRMSGSLPKVESFSDSRRKKVQARIRQGVTVEKFERAVTACSTKPFLSGNNDRGWTATFDWLIDNDRNIEKAITDPYGLVRNVGTRPNAAWEAFKETFKAEECA